MRLRLLFTAALSVGATGCMASIGLTQDPLAHEPTRSPRLALFSVDWWRPLVKPELLECVLEIATPPCPDVPAVAGELASLRGLARYVGVSPSRFRLQPGRQSLLSD